MILQTKDIVLPLLGQLCRETRLGLAPANNEHRPHLRYLTEDQSGTFWAKTSIENIENQEIDDWKAKNEEISKVLNNLIWSHGHRFFLRSSCSESFCLIVRKCCLQTHMNFPFNAFKMFEKKLLTRQAVSFVSSAWPRLCSKYQRVKLDGDPKCFGEAIPSSACS